MVKTRLLGDDRSAKLKQQKHIAKKANTKKRKSLLRFIKDIYAELKKVTWPTFKDLMVYTGAVITFIVIMAVIVYLFDLGLGALLDLAIS